MARTQAASLAPFRGKDAPPIDPADLLPGREEALEAYEKGIDLNQQRMEAQLRSLATHWGGGSGGD